MLLFMNKWTGSSFLAVQVSRAVAFTGVMKLSETITTWDADPVAKAKLHHGIVFIAITIVVVFINITIIN